MITGPMMFLLVISTSTWGNPFNGKGKKLAVYCFLTNHIILYFPGQQGGCAQIPSWMKTAIQQKSGLIRWIIQGQTAPEPIPWQAHMRQGSPWSFSYFCGGTILDAKTILTAAHCYYGKDLKDGSAQTAFVESITLHESYDENTGHKLDNDLAILKLKTPLTFNDKARAACLPDASFIPEGIAVASGWGLTGQFPDVSPSNLQVCCNYI